MTNDMTFDRRKIVLDTVRLMAHAAASQGVNFHTFYQEEGLHHDLLELAEPEDADADNPDYAAALDEFESELIDLFEDVGLSGLLELRYVCPDCNHQWNDRWECACDDTCPECGTNDISPCEVDGEDVTGAKEDNDETD